MTTLRPSARSVAGLYIPFDRSAGTPYYHQIYQGLRDAILEGRSGSRSAPSLDAIPRKRARHFATPGAHCVRPVAPRGISRRPHRGRHLRRAVGSEPAGTSVNRTVAEMRSRSPEARQAQQRHTYRSGTIAWSLSRRPACARSVSAKSLVPPGFATRAAVAGRADGLRRTPRASPSSRGCGRLFARGARRSLRALPGADGRRVPDGAAALCGGAAAGQRCCLRREPRLSRCVEGAGGDRRHDSRCST